MRTKLEYVLKQTSKTNKKNCENYVVTRIYNRLNDLDIKFVTQQYVTRGNGVYALTDMYFPQFKLHIEVDEPHHKHTVEQDKLREEEIINITNHKIMRIDFTKNIEEIHKDIDEIVNYIKAKKIELGDSFIKWDISEEYNPDRYIKAGEINLEDNVAFRTIVDCCKCFGLNYKGYQRGEAKHPIEREKSIWFPRLYVNERYSNVISDDGNTIYETNSTNKLTEEDINKILNHNGFRDTRIVFGRIIGPLGDVMYKFRGEFVIDKEGSLKDKVCIWRKTSNKVNTYNYKNKGEE